MDQLEPGLYETLITERLKSQLDRLAERLSADKRALRAAEASDRIAWHVGQLIERSLTDVSDEERVQVGLAVARGLVDRLAELVEVDPTAAPVDPATAAGVIGAVGGPHGSRENHARDRTEARTVRARATPTQVAISGWRNLSAQSALFFWILRD